MFGSAVVAVLWVGWLNREDNGLTPENGVGYWLGIVGASLMLLLLLYPLRKRVKKWWRAFGTIRFWFRAHMILGVVGPVLIILHSNFKLGSINSNVALIAMLVVAISGVVGRYLYGKIHVGLYGRKAEVREILADADALKQAIGVDLPVADRVVERLSAFAQLGTVSPKSVLIGLLLLPVIGLRASVVRMRLIADARQVITVEGKRLGWSRRVRRQRIAGVAELVTLHNAAVKKAAAFAFYERLFGLWHVFHLPLFLPSRGRDDRSRLRGAFLLSGGSLMSRQLTIARVIGVVIASALTSAAQSQNLFERLVMPGPVVDGHAKLEKECGKCHEPFSRKSQTRLCLDCHKEIAADRTTSKGFHGRQPDAAKQECNHCHTDHKGRDADIVQLDRETFNHALTNFELRDAHKAVPCSGCHCQR